jgi:hypothetical protein
VAWPSAAWTCFTDAPPEINAEAKKCRKSWVRRVGSPTASLAAFQAVDHPLYVTGWPFGSVKSRARPATGKTPQHSVRVDPVLWERARAKAETEGRTLSDVIRDCLVAFVAEDEPDA